MKLLRFLQERTFVPLGATEARTVDVRVVSATNRDLAAAVAGGRLPRGLLLPPQRLRHPRAAAPRAPRGRAPARGAASSPHGPARRRSSRPAARERLLEHRWPGNVRELENVARAGAHPRRRRTRSGPSTSAIGAARRAGRAGADVLVEGFNLDAFERELILAALERAGGNKTHAARMLGVTRRRLYSLLASHAEGASAEPDDA